MAQKPETRRVDWFAAGLGLILAVAVELAGDALFFRGHGDAFGRGFLTFGALLAGGFLAGYLGPAPAAVWNGIVAAIGFIVVAQLAGTVGPVGTGNLDTISLVVDDVIVLSAGTLGGGLARAARRVMSRGTKPSTPQRS
jgi:hypothetical protein